MRGEIRDIEPEQIHLAIKEARVLEQSAESVPDYGKAINIKTKRGVIKPRTPNQAQYIQYSRPRHYLRRRPAGDQENLPGGRRRGRRAGAPGDPPYSSDPSGGWAGEKLGFPARRFEPES